MSDALTAGYRKLLHGVMAAAKAERDTDGISAKLPYLLYKLAHPDIQREEFDRLHEPEKLDEQPTQPELTQQEDDLPEPRIEIFPVYDEDGVKPVGVVMRVSYLYLTK